MNHALVSMAMPGALQARQCFADKVKSTFRMRVRAHIFVVLNLIRM